LLLLFPNFYLPYFFKIFYSFYKEKKSGSTHPKFNYKFSFAISSVSCLSLCRTFYLSERSLLGPLGSSAVERLPLAQVMILGSQDQVPHALCMEPVETSVVSQEPTRIEKSTDTEEDNIAGPLFMNKTTQFPSVHAEVLLEPEETPEAACGGSPKPSTPKAVTPPSSPSPAAVSQEFAYVPADPAQFAADVIEDVAKKGSGSGDKRTPFGSYGIAGEITVTTAPVRRAET
uniref:Uncharacterized protein n=1 Tax=Canis lupus dingo TaxID=286419 RepID=A0A8C0KQA0_CANLU